jgi:hypothetical protein
VKIKNEAAGWRLRVGRGIRLGSEQWREGWQVGNRNYVKSMTIVINFAPE